MSRNTRIGTAAELAAAHELEADGYTVASRRHVGGAGDLLAVRWRPADEPGECPYHEVLLVEVKATARGPYLHFPPDDRDELMEEADRILAKPMLAWRKPGQKALVWIPSSDWPGVGEMAA